MPKSVALVAIVFLLASSILVLSGTGSVVLADWTFEEMVKVAGSQISASRDEGMGRQYSLAIKSDQSLVGWGDNTFGQTTIPAGDYTAVESGFTHVIGLLADGSVALWGTDFGVLIGRGDFGTLTPPTPNSGFTAVAAGGTHNMALKSDGSVVLWGTDLGPIAVGSDFGTLVPPTPNSDFVAISAGVVHNIALKTDGTLVLWGGDPYGSGVNLPPAPNKDFVAISAGSTHNLALKSDGSIVAWGANNFGQCDVPAPNTGFVAISAGPHHSLGLKSDGSIVSWGLDYGTPPTGTGYVGISAGLTHSLALHSDGTIAAWGENTYGGLDVPPPNSDFGYFPDEGELPEPPPLGPGEMAIWLEIEPTLITRLEHCETFGRIATGMHSQLTFPNVDDDDPYVEAPDAWPEYESGAYGQPLDAQDHTSLSQQGPGTSRQDNSLLKTERVDYNVSGNVSFNTDVYPVDDFRNVADPSLTVPITRLSIELRAAYGLPADGWGLYAGHGIANRIRTMTNQDPSVTENGLDFGLDLDIDLPDNTPPGLYKTTMVFMTYQL